MRRRAAGGRAFVQNVVALYGVHAVTYLLPLLTTPFLARTLGPAAWGLLAFTQAFAATLGLVVEYGFDLSATREVARAQSDRVRLAALLGGVTGAKALLALLAALGALAAQQLVPAFRAHPALLWAGVLWAMALASNVLWYFQGLERMKLVAVLDVAAKVLATAGIFALVRGPADAWRVPALQGAAALLSTAVAFTLAWRELPLARPRLREVTSALSLGWSMFVFRGSVSFYSTASAFLLGLFVAPQQVGYYAGAERIARALQGLLTPLSRAFYPRFSRAAGAGVEAARPLLAAGFRWMGLAGLGLSLAGLVGAPLMVALLLGSGFEASVPVLRLLAPLPFVIALNMVLGLFWLVPLGFDKAFNATIAGGALLNALLIVMFVPRFGALGMAASVVATEIAVGVRLYVLYRRTLRRPPRLALADGVEA